MYNQGVKGILEAMGVLEVGFCRSASEEVAYCQQHPAHPYAAWEGLGGWHCTLQPFVGFGRGHMVHLRK